MFDGVRLQGNRSIIITYHSNIVGQIVTSPSTLSTIMIEFQNVQHVQNIGSDVNAVAVS